MHSRGSVSSPIPGNLLLTVLRRWFWCNSYLVFYEVCVLCHILYYIVIYLFVNCSGSITSFGEERELICLLSFTCYYVIPFRRGFLFLWVLEMGCVILLWHSLSLPYNYVLNFNIRLKSTAYKTLMRPQWNTHPLSGLPNRQNIMYKLNYDLVAIPVPDYSIPNRLESKFIHLRGYNYDISYFCLTLVGFR